jgi:hypothetical protein
MYGRDNDLVFTEHIRKKQPPLYVMLNKQFETKKQHEEKLIQEKLQ